MILRQLLHTDPAIAVSYLVGCGGRGVAAVIDPVDEPDAYVRASAAHGMTIQYVIDTHVHADHASTGRSLAAAARAAYVLGPDAHAAFAVREVRDGNTLPLGNVTLRVLHTPGHTPEHVTVLAIDGTRAPEPWLAFTGHTLMVGDMGRTELASSAVEGAAALFDSAERLRELPDHVLVLPGAFAGSVCGRGLSATPVSTIGFERRCNRAFAIRDRDVFVRHMLHDIPEPPPRATETRAANLGRPAAALRP